MCTTSPVHIFFPDLITEYCVKSINYELPHYIIIPLLCYFISLRPKYSLCHFVLKQRQYMFFPHSQRPSFTFSLHLLVLITEYLERLLNGFCAFILRSGMNERDFTGVLLFHRVMPNMQSRNKPYMIADDC